MEAPGGDVTSAKLGGVRVSAWTQDLPLKSTARSNQLSHSVPALSLWSVLLLAGDMAVDQWAVLGHFSQAWEKWKLLLNCILWSCNYLCPRKEDNAKWDRFFLGHEVPPLDLAPATQHVLLVRIDQASLRWMPSPAGTLASPGGLVCLSMATMPIIL